MYECLRQFVSLAQERNDHATADRLSVEAADFAEILNNMPGTASGTGVPTSMMERLSDRVKTPSARSIPYPRAGPFYRRRNT